MKSANWNSGCRTSTYREYRRGIWRGCPVRRQDFSGCQRPCPGRRCWTPNLERAFSRCRPARGAFHRGSGHPQRCLALTGAFETSTAVPDCYCGLTGNSDSQGISFGVLQWTLGQGTLQPMLGEMLAAHAEVAANIFHDNLQALTAMLASDRDRQLAWAGSSQDPIRFTVFEPWKGLFKALGRTPEYQAIQA